VCRNVMVVWKKLFLIELLFEYMFFEMGPLRIFSKFCKKNYRGTKLLELPETCRSGKIYFLTSRRKNLLHPGPVY
jgi:hypothetical protein